MDIDILYSLPLSTECNFGRVWLKEVDMLSTKYVVKQIPPTGDELVQDHITSNSDFIENTRSLHSWSRFSLLSIREANIRNIPSVLESMSMHVLDQKNILKNYFKLNKYTVKKMIKEYHECKYMVVPSSLVKRSMIKRGIDESKIHIVPYGVDVDKFDFKRIEHDGFRILYVGPFTYRKNVISLVKAFREMNTNKKCELFLVGDGCNKLTDIANNIYGMSYMSDDLLIKKYQSSDLLVYPSIMEGFGLTVLESLSCGTPVIVSNMTGIRDIVHDRIGFVVEPKTNVLREFIKYALEYDFSARECRKVAEKNKWDINMKKLLNLYDSII